MMAKTKTMQTKTNKKAPASYQGFFAETKKELGRVEWPKRNTVINSSLVILVLVAFFTGLVALFDMSYSRLFLALKGF